MLSGLSFSGARYPSGKGEVCKTFMRRFDSDPRLQFPSSVFTNKTCCAKKSRPELPTSCFPAARSAIYVRLFRAAQVAIIIDDVALALLIVIEMGWARFAAVACAICFQIVALNPDIPTTLRIRAARH